MSQIFQPFSTVKTLWFRVHCVQFCGVIGSINLHEVETVNEINGNVMDENIVSTQMSFKLCSCREQLIQ